MSPHAPLFTQIDQAITDAGRILLLNPERGDGDSLGSTLAFAHRLQELDKPHDIFCYGLHTGYAFLPRFEEVQSDPDILDLSLYDLIITTDFADPRMTGIHDRLASLDREKTRVINIDHHPTNFQFGDINLVDLQSAATCEIVHDLFVELGWAISRDTATCLLTGVLTDTGIFANRNTTDRSLHIAAQLLALGARMRLITDFIYRNKSIGALKLWGKALTRLQYNKDTGIVTTFLTINDMEECGVDDDAAGGIPNFLNALDGAKAVLVLRELGDGRIKGSFRTTGDEVDVAELAAKFGGGGHRRAAGFSIKGRLAPVNGVWQVV